MVVQVVQRWGISPWTLLILTLAFDQGMVQFQVRPVY
jgi:hypothetical protein